MNTFLVLLCALATAGAEDLPFDPAAIVEQVYYARGELPRALALDSFGFMLDTTPLGHRPRTLPLVYKPAVASNGTDYLVVWKAEVSRHPIYGARVTGTGRLLDPDGFRISMSTMSRSAECAVAWGDSGYLVLWEYYDAIGWHQIRGALVSADGRVRLEEIVITDDPAHHCRPAVDYDGTKFIVAWDASDGRRWDIRATPVSTTGQVRYPNGLQVHRGLSLKHTNLLATVAALPSGSLVAWASDQTGEWDILGTVLDSAGVPADTIPIIIGGEGYGGRNPSIAFDGANYLVAWDTGEDARGDILATRVSLAGEVLDRHPIVVCTHASSQREPSVAFDGTNYLVAWQDWRNGANPDVYGARVAPTGVVLDPEGINWGRIQRQPSRPVIAGGTGISLLAYLEASDGWRGNIWAALIGPDGTVLGDEFSVPDALEPLYAPQYRPDVAYDGANYLAVWQTMGMTDNQWNIYGIRVSPEGELLDPHALAVATGPWAQQAPRVAFGDSVFLVVWEDARDPSRRFDIYGTRVSRTGVVLDPDGIPVLSRDHLDLRVPAVAFDGSNFLVIWHTTDVEALWGRFVDQGGRPLGDSFIVLDQGQEARTPALAFGDSIYLAAWDGGGVRAIRITPGGEVPDSTRIVVRGGGLPAVSHDGARFCVALRDGVDIYAARVTNTGEVLDPDGFRVWRGAGSVGGPDIIFNGHSYLLAWERNSVLFGARMSPSGRGVESFRLSHTPGRNRTPALARGPGRQSLVAYSCSTGLSRATVPRAWARFYEDDLSPLPLQLLSPPDSHVFHDPPVVLLVDTLRTGLDSFDFQVMLVGDTLWRGTLAAPLCTVPDEVLVPGAYHRWTCRAFANGRWSPYSLPWHFGYKTTGIGQVPGSALPSLAGASVLRRGQSLVRAGPVGPGPLRLEVFGPDGRRVAAITAEAGRAPDWDFRDPAGRPVAAGIYFVRLTDAGGSAQRKFILLD